MKMIDQFLFFRFVAKLLKNLFLARSTFYLLLEEISLWGNIVWCITRICFWTFIVQHYPVWPIFHNKRNQGDCSPGNSWNLHLRSEFFFIKSVCHDNINFYSLKMHNVTMCNFNQICLLTVNVLTSCFPP